MDLFSDYFFLVLAKFGERQPPRRVPVGLFERIEDLAPVLDAAQLVAEQVRRDPSLVEQIVRQPSSDVLDAESFQLRHPLLHLLVAGALRLLVTHLTENVLDVVCDLASDLLGRAEVFHCNLLNSFLYYF